MIKIFISLLFFLSGAASAAIVHAVDWDATSIGQVDPITHPRRAEVLVRIDLQPRMNVEQYLVYFLRKIPLAQLRPDGDVFRLTGRLNIDVSALAFIQREELIHELTRVFKGERKISGAWFDASEVKYRFTGEPFSGRNLLPEYLEDKVRKRIEDADSVEDIKRDLCRGSLLPK